MVGIRENLGPKKDGATGVSIEEWFKRKEAANRKQMPVALTKPFHVIDFPISLELWEGICTSYHHISGSRYAADISKVFC